MKTLAIAALAALFAFPAFAARCYHPDDVVAGLQNTYGEFEVDHEKLPDPNYPDVIVDWYVYVNPDNGSWTFFGVANGRACVFAVGKDYNGQKVRFFLHGEVAA